MGEANDLSNLSEKKKKELVSQLLAWLSSDEEAHASREKSERHHHRRRRRRDESHADNNTNRHDSTERRRRRRRDSEASPRSHSKTRHKEHRRRRRERSEEDAMIRAVSPPRASVPPSPLTPLDTEPTGHVVVSTKLSSLSNVRPARERTASPTPKVVAALSTLYNALSSPERKVVRKPASPRAPSLQQPLNRVLEYSPRVAPLDPEDPPSLYYSSPEASLKGKPARRSMRTNSVRKRSESVGSRGNGGVVWSRLYSQGVTDRMTRERVSAKTAREREAREGDFTFRPSTTMRDEADADLRERPNRVFSSLYSDSGARARRLRNLRDERQTTEQQRCTFAPVVNPPSTGGPPNSEFETDYYKKLFLEATTRREKQKGIEEKARQADLQRVAVHKSSSQSQGEFRKRVGRSLQQGTVEVGWMRRVYASSRGGSDVPAPKGAEVSQIISSLESDLKIKQIREMPRAVWQKMIPRTDFEEMLNTLSEYGPESRMKWERFIGLFHELTVEAHPDPECTHFPDTDKIHNPRKTSRRGAVRSGTPTRRTLTPQQVRQSTDRLYRNGRSSSATPTQSERRPGRSQSPAAAVGGGKQPSLRREGSKGILRVRDDTSPTPAPRRDAPAPTPPARGPKVSISAEPDIVVTLESGAEDDDELFRSPSETPIPAAAPVPVPTGRGRPLQEQVRPVPVKGSAHIPVPHAIKPIQSNVGGFVLADDDDSDDFHTDEDEVRSPEQVSMVPSRQLAPPPPRLIAAAATASVVQPGADAGALHAKTHRAMEDLKKKLLASPGTSAGGSPAVAPRSVAAKGVLNAVGAPGGGRGVPLSKLAAHSAVASPPPAQMSKQASPSGGSVAAPSPTLSKKQPPHLSPVGGGGSGGAPHIKSPGAPPQIKSPSVVHAKAASVPPTASVGVKVHQPIAHGQSVPAPGQGAPVHVQNTPTKSAVKQPPNSASPPKESSRPATGTAHPPRLAMSASARDPLEASRASSTGSALRGSVKVAPPPGDYPGTPRGGPKSASGSPRGAGSSQRGFPAAGEGKAPPGFQGGAPPPQQQQQQRQEEPAPPPGGYQPTTTKKKVSICKKCNKDTRYEIICKMTGKEHKSSKASTRSDTCGSCQKDINAFPICEVTRQPHRT